MKRLFFIMLLVSLTGLLSAQNNGMTTGSGDEASTTSVLVKGAVPLEAVSIAGEIDVWLGKSYTYYANPGYSDWTYVWEIEKDHRCSFSTSGNVLSVTFNQNGVYQIMCYIYDANMNFVGGASIEALTRYP